MYPLLLKPPVKDYLWGGTKLKTEYGLKTDKNISAEGWMLSCHKDGSNIVLNGEYNGKTLPEVLEIWGDKALGENASKFEYFPILIKLIDAKDKLSVQVHPDDEYALKNEGEYGKTEMWYVVDCEEGAELIYGFNREVEKQEFEQRIKDNTLSEICNYVPVKKGDVFFISAGTLHAIGEGILIAEVQQNSNTTYRVSDYGRLGADGKPRELHIEKALDVTERNVATVPYGNVGKVENTSFGSVRDLAECELFTSKLISLNGETDIFCEESFVSLVTLDGELSINYNNQTIKATKGSSVFVPAGLNVTIKGKETFKNTVKLDVEPHKNAEIKIEYNKVAYEYGATLNISLTKNGKEYAKTQHILPCEIVKAEETDKADLTEDKLNIYAKGDRFSYTFNKHYGVFTSIIVDGEEQLDGKTVLSAMRAPTDNDSRMLALWTKKNIWQGENLDCAFNKVYDCEIVDGKIIVNGSVAGVSRVPVFKYTLEVAVLNNGKIDFNVNAIVRKDAQWLPRFVFEFSLNGNNKEFTYYGMGPNENYCDLCHHSSIGLYSSNTDKEYVKYVRPQEHGNHIKTKMLKIGKLIFESENGFEFNASNYSTDALFKAQHTDELVADGKTHLRIDYKVSGIGSASCGPNLQSKYQLNEKQIDFCFCINIC